MTGEKQIVIVGGGLVGSLLGVMLGRRGYHVTVYEKRSDMRFRAVAAGRSINLALAERGLHALRQAGLDDEVKPLLIPMRGRMLHTPDGALNFSPYGQRPHEVIYSVSRGHLNREMLAAADEAENVKLFFEHECVAVDLENRQIELVNYATGEKVTRGYDILLGTDGAASAVRSAIATATKTEWHTEWLDHDYKELEIPAGPNGEFLADKNSLHIWPRHGYMLIALPNLDGSFTVTLFLQSEGDPGFDKLEDLDSVKRFFSEQFPDAMALIPDLSKEFFENPTGKLGTVRCRKWTDGQYAMILGDASHAIVPFHGQGMNAGFEDCAVLARLLAQSDGDWAETMRQFEAERLPDAHAIAQMALENYITMRDSVLDPHFHLKKAAGFALEQRWPNRFVPRYSMVMFHRIPYDTVWQRGKIQDQILEQLLAGKSDAAQIDFALAESLVNQRLTELPASMLNA